MSQRAWAWRAFYVTALAYVPIFVGAIFEPEQLNLVAWFLWIILAGLFMWSSKAQGYWVWRMSLGYLVGNTAIISLALCQGGYTMNLGESEMITLVTLVTTIGYWAAHGLVTKKHSPAILYLGCIAADVLSVYPQVKQYWGPNDTPWFALGGWLLFILGAAINLLLAEEFVKKLSMTRAEHFRVYGAEKNILGIIQESALSLDQLFLVTITACVMAW